MSEYDIPGLADAVPAFLQVVHRGQYAAQAVTQLRTSQHQAKRGCRSTCSVSTPGSGPGPRRSGAAPRC